jgi:DNA-binding MarR family transcriptional regulator
VAADPAVRLQHIATRLIRLARAPGRAEGLSSSQYSAMAVIEASPGISVVELARREMVTHPTMSRIVASMAKAGLVTRVADPNDRRAQRISLTEAGRAAYLQAAERRVALFRMVLARLSPAARAEVLELADELGVMAGVPREAP